MPNAKQAQFNVELVRLINRYATEQELLNTSKHLISRSLNMAEGNLSFREALSALIARSFRVE